jgi:hypothetical protein
VAYVPRRPQNTALHRLVREHYATFVVHTEATYTQGIDALRCPRCTGRMRAMATLPEPGAVKKILAHLGLPTEPLPRARAGDPTGQESFDFDAA